MPRSILFISVEKYSGELLWWTICPQLAQDSTPVIYCKETSLPTTLYIGDIVPRLFVYWAFPPLGTHAKNTLLARVADIRPRRERQK